MAFPLNEYKILRIIKTYFTALQNDDSVVDLAFDYLFDTVDIDEQDRNAFKDIIKNGKINYTTTYNNLSVDLPNIVCIMDLEIQHSDYQAIGDKLDHDEIITSEGVVLNSDNYGKIEAGTYTINILSKSILLVRLLGLLTKYILEHYATNNDDTFYDMEISSDRFAPDAEYFPNDVFHIHLMVRFKYIESWPEFESKIQGIFMQACGSVAKYITKPMEAEISFNTTAKIKGKSS